jgi:hypothetical protein
MATIPGVSITYVAANQFLVEGDREYFFRPNQRLRVNMQAAGIVEGTVDEAVYQTGEGTTLISVLRCTLDPLAYRVELGTTFCDYDNQSGNLAEHDHSAHYAGGYIPASLFSEVQVLNLQLIPVVDTGDGNKFLRESAAGDAYEMTDLLGTTNQIVVTHFANETVLSLPQDIHTAATPTFAGMTITSWNGIGLFTAGVESVITGTRGDILVRGASAWGVLAKGASGYVLQAGASDTAWAELDGDLIDIDWDATWYTPVIVTESVDADDLSSHLKGIDNALGASLASLADVRLVLDDVNIVSVYGVDGTTQSVMVGTILVPFTTPESITLDSASDFVITGTTTVAKGTALDSYTDYDYTDYGIHYIYVCDTNDCWNFASYDRRGLIILSAIAPQDNGYLAASGDGTHARCVGAVIVNSSRELESEFSVASVYNGWPPVASFVGETDSWGAITEGTANSLSLTCNLVIPDGWFYAVDVHAAFRNEDTDPCSFLLELLDDSTTLAEQQSSAASIAGYSSEVVMSLSYTDFAVGFTTVLLSLQVTPTGTDSSPTANERWQSMSVRLIPYGVSGR